MQLNILAMEDRVRPLQLAIGWRLLLIQNAIRSVVFACGPSFSTVYKL